MFLWCQVELDSNYNWTITNTNEEGMAEASFEQLGVKVREQSKKEEVKTFCLVASMETIGLSQMQHKTGLSNHYQLVQKVCLLIS